MAFNRILIANRGEIAIRLSRAIADCDATSVAVYAEDDAQSLHVRSADQAVALQGQGVAAYLDAAQLIRIAKEQDCDAIHPGYGFLSTPTSPAHASRPASPLSAPRLRCSTPLATRPVRVDWRSSRVCR